MEVLYGRSKARFTNSRLGSFKHGERVTGHAPLMRQLAGMGLIELDEDVVAKKPSGDGVEKPSSVSQAAEVLPTTTAELPKKRKRTKKPKLSS